MCCEKEIYDLVDLGALKVKNIDLSKKVRYRNKTYYKIDKLCLNNRKYSDYLKFINENKDINMVEMGSVKVLKVERYCSHYIL